MSAQQVGAAGVGVLARWPFWRANVARFHAEQVWADAGDAPASALAVVGRHGGRALVGLGDPQHLARLLGTVDLPGNLVGPDPEVHQRAMRQAPAGGGRGESGRHPAAAVLGHDGHRRRDGRPSRVPSPVLVGATIENLERARP